MNRFVGRQTELADLRQLLGHERVITLVGPGGCGKTRLAKEVAADPGDFRDGAAIIELAPFSDAALVPGSVAAALGLRTDDARATTELVIGTLRNRQQLLVFDNCEHLLEPVAELVDTLARSCEQVASSRRAASRLRVRALGTMRVERDGEPLAPRDWVYGKPRELLAFLLLHGPCTREQLGNALWPDSAPEQARNSLGVSLHRLRRALGDPTWIRFADATYAIDRSLSVWFDVGAFRDARRAASRSSGDDRVRAHLDAIALYEDDFSASRVTRSGSSRRGRRCATSCSSH